MDFSTLESRKEFVNNLTSYVKEHYSDKFNMFIFGSFLTNNFMDGKSDIDIATYTSGSFMELDWCIEDFIGTQIDYDIVHINPDSILNSIDMYALHGYRCTTWFPECLRKHQAELACTNLRDFEFRVQWYDALQTGLNTMAKRKESKNE